MMLHYLTRCDLECQHVLTGNVGSDQNHLISLEFTCFHVQLLSCLFSVTAYQ